MSGALDPSSDADALSVATQAARAAGEALLGYLTTFDRGGIRSKSAERDLVTEADVAAERLIVERVRSAFPSHRIQSEEEVQDAGALDEGDRWFIDPLDGTVNFVHALPCFAVSIALFRAGVPRVGVVFVPRLGELFAARAGGGAWLNGTPIQVSKAGALGEAVLATGFPYRRHELEHNNLANVQRFFNDVRGLRRMGSAAIDLAYTAAGRLDGYWELHLGAHDLAAGALLVREAGGVVTDADGGDDWLARGHVVAAGEALHGAILERVVSGS